MKCPRCGREMTQDSHRKYDVMMCYECGYMEGRSLGEKLQTPSFTNYERLRRMSFNEAIPFLAAGLHLDERRLSAWLERVAD